MHVSQNHRCCQIQHELVSTAAKDVKRKVMLLETNASLSGVGQRPRSGRKGKALTLDLVTLVLHGVGHA